jgi:hypothetical protein
MPDQEPCFFGQKSDDELVKSLFANDFEHFGVKAIEMFGVKKC